MRRDPNFEGHVMPNKDEYKKSVAAKFRYCVQVSQFTVSLLITCILVVEIEFEIVHFLNFRTTMTLTLDLVTWHTVAYQSLTST